MFYYDDQQIKAKGWRRHLIKNKSLFSKNKDWQSALCERNKHVSSYIYVANGCYAFEEINAITSLHWNAGLTWLHWSVWQSVMCQMVSRWKSWFRAAPLVGTPALQVCWTLGYICSPRRSPAASSAWLGHCEGAGGQKARALCGSSNRPSHWHRPCRCPQTLVHALNRWHTEPG